jgi:hypothetical protein
MQNNYLCFVRQSRSLDMRTRARCYKIIYIYSASMLAFIIIFRYYHRVNLFRVKLIDGRASVHVHHRIIRVRCAFGFVILLNTTYTISNSIYFSF